jgi:hypothetical protein
LLTPEGQTLLAGTDEFDYLTHIVFRMYENKIVSGCRGRGSGTCLGYHIVGVVYLLVLPHCYLAFDQVANVPPHTLLSTHIQRNIFATRLSHLTWCTDLLHHMPPCRLLLTPQSASMLRSSSATGPTMTPSWWTRPATPCPHSLAGC